MSDEERRRPLFRGDLCLLADAASLEIAELARDAPGTAPHAPAFHGESAPLQSHRKDTALQFLRAYYWCKAEWQQVADRPKTSEPPLRFFSDVSLLRTNLRGIDASASFATA